jgi:hypothetical protein
MKQKTKTETRNMGDQKNHNAYKQNRSLMQVKKKHIIWQNKK